MAGGRMDCLASATNSMLALLPKAGITVTASIAATLGISIAGNPLCECTATNTAAAAQRPLHFRSPGCSERLSTPQRHPQQSAPHTLLQSCLMKQGEAELKIKLCKLKFGGTHHMHCAPKRSDQPGVCGPADPAVTAAARPDKARYRRQLRAAESGLQPPCPSDGAADAADTEWSV